MFELFSGGRRRSQRTTVPVLISTVAHVIVVGVLVAIPFVYVATDLPEVPDMLAFVVSAAPPPPPPPPPPPAPAATPANQRVIKPVPAVSPRAAPVEAPAQIVEETHVATDTGEGVSGGVLGGVPGGVVGGIVGGIAASDLSLPTPPPPPAAPPVERTPVRVGGAVEVPALLKRVEPEYPIMAARAKVQGVVILEAVVDRKGQVEDVRVLRSIPLLDGAAIAAVRQWRYSPLLLNGQPQRFVLTVTLSFRLST
jgi:protein TonB